ncbi:MAG: phosphopantothenoylcysteine decarboxylase, partial [Gemmataceae bacterium]|nr:phosphopantothenoylcysteine decarboxylase [Gemmataceae bacterium]
MAKILLGVTGSVAAVRTPLLVRELLAERHAVKVAATESSLHFFDPAELPAGVLHRDSDEWPAGRYQRGDPVLHIELRNWADLFLIAPLDAHTLAKLALGLCDNLPTCVARAWPGDKPLALAPAMNTLMWEQPVTARHLAQISDDRQGRLAVIGAIAEELARGDVRVGGMTEVPDIVAAVGR